MMEYHSGRPTEHLFKAARILNSGRYMVIRGDESYQEVERIEVGDKLYTNTVQRRAQIHRLINLSAPAIA